MIMHNDFIYNKENRSETCQKKIKKLLLASVSN